MDSILEGYANVELRLDRLDAAEGAASQSLAERRARKDADAALLAAPLVLLARLALRRGHVAEARSLATEAEADFAGVQPPPGDHADALITLAEADIAVGDGASAHAALGSALWAS